jgi:hypothetical protein
VVVVESYIVNIALDAYRKRGLQYVISRGTKFMLYSVTDPLFCWYYRKFTCKTFQFRGKSYNYFFDLRGQTWRTERSVEIPIVWKIVNENQIKNKKILEVGNVLYQRFPISLDVVDKYEVMKGVINEDIVEFNPTKKYDLIASISTMEHVGWDEKPRDPPKILRGLQKLKTLLSPSGQLIVTMPLGYNQYLDDLIKDDYQFLDNQYYMKRVSGRIWQEVTCEKIKNSTYNKNMPWPSANGIVVCVNKELDLKMHA